MKAHVMKLENNCVIVDEEYFNSLKEKSELNEVRIKELSEEMFLKYIKEECHSHSFLSLRESTL